MRALELISTFSDSIKEGNYQLVHRQALRRRESNSSGHFRKLHKVALGVSFIGIIFPHFHFTFQNLRCPIREIEDGREFGFESGKGENRQRA